MSSFHIQMSSKGLEADKYEFELKKGEEVVATAKNAADGTVTFKEIEFETAGDYTYTITEKAGSEKGVTYDTANFVGKGTGVTIVRKDKNGTPVTATYRPTVVDPSTGHDTASTGAKGQPQVATPTFEGHIDSTVPPTFEDGSTTTVVPGEGSYTIDKDGKITFTPEPDFVGTAKGLVVKRHQLTRQHMNLSAELQEKTFHKK
ncbi:hypothetical protein V470_10260 [Streptococcus sp. VT 162]|nr:hypothetical protein V470_10260 [Streptococcus sp. VT 162]